MQNLLPSENNQEVKITINSCMRKLDNIWLSVAASNIALKVRIFSKGNGTEAKNVSPFGSVAAQSIVLLSNTFRNAVYIIYTFFVSQLLSSCWQSSF